LPVLAIARAFDLELSLGDFQRISDETPFLADLKPSGQYVMQDLHDVRGVSGVIKLMLNEGLLNGDCLTVTGRTIEENLKELDPLHEDQKLYSGFTENLEDRLDRHHRGSFPATMDRMPIQLITYLFFFDKYKAIEYEKYLQTGCFLPLRCAQEWESIPLLELRF